MKIIVFGVGTYYQNRKEKFEDFDNIEIIALADNDISMWNKRVDDTVVISPNLILNLTYDKIVIMSIHVREIHFQLLNLGIDENKIITWERFYKEQLQLTMKFYKPILPNKEENKKKVLIITQKMEYDGGTLAAIYASMALRNRGMSVALFAPDGDKKLINEVVNKGVTVCTCMSLPYIFKIQKEWVREFDVVIVNLFTMMESAYEVVQVRPVLWWIHEASLIYALIDQEKKMVVHEECMNLINIYAVSKIAQQNFNTGFKNRIKNTLTAGIPDDNMFNRAKNNRNKVVFAIIGNVHIIKLFHVFLEAAESMNADKNAEFWVIGRVADDNYGSYIKQMASYINSVRMFGELTRTELQKAFEEIDVVACTSNEETLSLTIIEGMMHGKVCITTENTGIAAYIQDGVNGYVIPVNDAIALTEKMQYILENNDQLEGIRRAARKTYEKYFSLKILGRNLEAALDETEQKWKERNQYQEQ
ncbi:MAG: glycosyltransferase family 4 protein [Lachnospiraceae bacterium]